MCLDSVTTTVKDPAGTILSGWKHFGGSDSSPTFEVMSLRGKGFVPLDEWIEAEETQIKDGSGRTKYTTGFHIYSDETNRPRGVTFRRVFYRGVKTVGVQSSHPCVIASQMYVPSESEAWPPLRK